jgi:hypothetical protein
MRGGKHDEDKEELLLMLMAICVLQLHVDGLLEKRKLFNGNCVEEAREEATEPIDDPPFSCMVSSGEHATIVVRAGKVARLVHGSICHVAWFESDRIGVRRHYASVSTQSNGHPRWGSIVINSAT